MVRSRANSKLSFLSVPESSEAPHVSEILEAPSRVSEVLEAPSHSSLHGSSVGRSIGTHATATLSALSPNRSFAVDKSTLMLKEIDFDDEGHLSEFLHIAEADKNWHRRKERFDTNTNQMEVWARKIERLQQESAIEAAKLQSRYAKDTYEMQYGCPRVHIKSPYKGLHRRMKAEVLGKTFKPASGNERSGMFRPSSAPPGGAWDAMLEHEFRRVRLDASQRDRCIDFPKRTRWDRVATMEMISQQHEGLPNCTEDSSDEATPKKRSNDCYRVFPKFVCTHLLEGLCSPEVVQGIVVSEAEARVADEVLKVHSGQMKTIHDKRNHYLKTLNQAERQYEKEVMERQLRQQEEDKNRKLTASNHAAKFCQILNLSINSRPRSGLPRACRPIKPRETVNTREDYTGGPLHQRQSQLPLKRMKTLVKATLHIQQCWKVHKARMNARRRVNQVEP